MIEVIGRMIFTYDNILVIMIEPIWKYYMGKEWEFFLCDEKM